jgi:hypothetical protein
LRRRTPAAEDLQHLFDLLGVLYDPDTLDLCYRSLLTADPGLRGTALEYLENLLPPEVREELWPVIAAGEGAKGAKRPLPEIVRDLLKAARHPRRVSSDADSETPAAATGGDSD